MGGTGVWASAAPPDSKRATSTVVAACMVMLLRSLAPRLHRRAAQCRSLADLGQIIPPRGKADARGPCRAPQGRDREVVADRAGECVLGMVGPFHDQAPLVPGGPKCARRISLDNLLCLLSTTLVPAWFSSDRTIGKYAQNIWKVPFGRPSNLLGQAKRNELCVWLDHS